MSAADSHVPGNTGLAEGIAVVYLFTSEGCSTCPPADHALSGVVERARLTGDAIFALSYHVDYWNRLGWKDPYSEARWSARQRDYATRTNDGVYTPQCLVNGSASFVGSDRMELNKSVASAWALPASAFLSAEALQGAHGIEVHYSMTGTVAGTELNAAVVQRTLVSQVKAGEDRGPSLSHTNVVRSFKATGLSEDTRWGSIQLQLPVGCQVENCDVILFVQREYQGTILGAAKLAISPQP